MDRWRGRRLAGLAVVVLLVMGSAAAVAMARDGSSRWVVVRDDAGAELARAALPPSNQFALRYRNSVYKSIADEHFVAANDHLTLVGLEADELAVLEEYYTAVGAIRAAPDASLTWSVAVDRPPIALPLRVQATALGQRTLLTAQGEIPLWRLVDGRDDTLVILTIEGPD